jgi:hypothetical protein
VSLRNSEHSLKAALNAADDSANRASDRASNGTGSTVALSGALFRAPDNALSLRHQRQPKNRRDTRSYHQAKSHVPSPWKTVVRTTSESRKHIFGMVDIDLAQSRHDVRCRISSALECGSNYWIAAVIQIRGYVDPNQRRPPVHAAT